MRKTFFVAAVIALTFLGCSKDASELTKAKGKSGSITRFAAHNGYMYALDQNRILVYSLANVANPQLVNTVQTEYGLETIIVYENVVYIGSTTALYIMNISNPAAPFIVGKSDREVLRGGCDPVVVKDNYAYSTVKIIENVCGEVSVVSQLLVYDVSDQTAPTLVGSYDMNIPNGLGYKGDHLFVCDEGDDSVVIFDISNPESLQYQGSFDLQDPVDVIVDNNRMIISAKTDFNIYNISDIENITPMGSIPF